MVHPNCFRHSIHETQQRLSAGIGRELEISCAVFSAPLGLFGPVGRSVWRRVRGVFRAARFVRAGGEVCVEAVGEGPSARFAGQDGVLGVVGIRRLGTERLLDSLDLSLIHI